MKVTVICFGAMKEYLPAGSGNEAPLEIDESGTVGDLVDALGAPRRLVHALLVDGRQSTLDRRLQEGAVVTLMPPFAGGRQRKGAPHG